MKRNITVDIIRGVAMLMVALQHTMSGSTNDAQHSFLFNVVWSLQLPLFIIISGYVTKYSRPIGDVTSLWHFICNRTMAYLFPWAVWTFLVRGFVFNQQYFFDIKYLLWHMDAGYWFLTTIWSICMFFGVADYCTSKLNITRLYAKIVAHCLFCGLGMIILALIGLKMGLNFLAIKLTLYYFPIYLLGYIYGQLEDTLANIRHYCNIRECVIIISAAIWVAALSRVYVFDCADSGLDILLRFTISIFGCIFVCGLISGIYPPPHISHYNWEYKNLYKQRNVRFVV